MKSKTILAASLASFITCAISHAIDLTWDGVGGSTWNTATSSNWTGSVWAAGDNATFSSAGVGTVTVASGVSVNNLTFNTAGYTLTGEALAITGALAVNADTNIATNLLYGGGDTTITNATLAMTNGASLYYATDWWVNSQAVVTVGAGGTLQLGGWGWGSPGLNFLYMTPNHLVIDGGTVEQKFAGNNWGTRGFTIGTNGATLKNSMTSGISYMQDGWGIQITNNSSLSLTGDGAGSVDIDQIISGTGSLTKTGTGTWILSRANTYTGPTTINQGTLSVTQPTFAPDALLTIASGAVLNLPTPGITYLNDLSINGTLVTDRAVYNSTNTGGAITGPGQIKRGGTLTWNATTDSNWDNSTANWTGTYTTWSSLDNAIFGSAATPGTVNVGTGVSVNNLTFSSAGYTIAGNPLVVAGTLTVSADTTIDTNIPTGGGNTTITNATLAMTHGASLYYTTDWAQESPAVVTVGAGGTLQLGGWGWGSPGLSFLQPYPNHLVIDGGTVEVKCDVAQWGNRSFTVGTGGATFINSTSGGGWVRMANSFGADIANNSSLTLSGDGTNFMYIDHNITGTGSVTKSGTSLWYLGGTNTYTGPTTVTAGTLDFAGNSQTLGAVILEGGTIRDGTITSATTYDVRSGTVSATLAGTAGLTKTTAGTVTLTGTNSYSGATTVTGGTLSISAPNLSTTATLSIASGAVLNLPFTGTNIVGSLVLHGVTQPDNLYDSTNTNGAITGTGKIQVGSAGSPAYLLWATTFTGFTDTYPGHDPDGDGMTNQQEFAFNLDPTSGASNNPIVVPFDKTTGKFSYTRLDPMITGLSYTIYTSNDLKTWTADGGASQVPSSGVYQGDEIVAVTLSPGLLTAAKLFVRVAAQ
jgi:autotransporter-associated beta strand protein